MFSELTLEKYAEVMHWALQTALGRKLKKSSLVLVRYDLAAVPLAEAMVRLLHDAGMVPIPRANPTARMEHAFYTLANNRRLTCEIPGEAELYRKLTGTISLIAPESLTHLSAVDPELMALARNARRPLRDILAKREDLGEYAWTLCIYPSEEPARRADMTPSEFGQTIKEACLLTDGTPLTRWKLLYKQMHAVRDWLNALDVRSLRVESDSMDMLIKMGERRKWVALSGRNIPSFEIYTSPDWRGTEGTFRMDLPSFRSGNRVADMHLTFRGGEVVEMRAEEGQRFAQEELTSDAGARRVGEFALVDKHFSPIRRFMANTLYDENHGGEQGSCHIALGNSYSNTFAGPRPQLNRDTRAKLGFNTSGLHWDLVNTEKKRVTAVLADGRKTTIYEDGQFAY